MSDALEPTDEHLVSLSKDGNLSAFNSLVERYQAAVFNLCLRFIGDRGAAEDAAQEAFLSAYRSIERFSGGNFRSWLFRIAANESKDELRRRSRRPVESLPAATDEADRMLEFSDEAESAEAYVERKAVRRLLEDALRELPFEQRQVIVLADIHGFHYEEIAEVTGMNVGTVKSRIHRGRERLRKALSGRPELFEPPERLEE